MVKVQPLDVPLAGMDPHSLDYWLAKFVQKVAKTYRKSYPPKPMRQIIVVGKRRHLLENKPGLDFNFLDGSDKWSVFTFFCHNLLSPWLKVQLSFILNGNSIFGFIGSDVHTSDIC